jgi:hypothetical protein
VEPLVRRQMQLSRHFEFTHNLIFNSMGTLTKFNVGLFQSIAPIMRNLEFEEMPTEELWALQKRFVRC